VTRKTEAKGPILLRALWWICSKRYRRFGTPERAESAIGQVAGQHGITRAQAFAMIWADMPERWRPWISGYRPSGGDGEQ